MRSHSPAPWVVTDSVTNDRKNIFSMARHAQSHIATIIAGSRRDLARFDSDLALMKAAPEMLSALETTLELLDDHPFLQSARAQATAQQIRSLLARVAERGRLT